MTWLADSFYDVQFKHDSDITERVIFTVSDSESRGIEDARFVRFIDDDKTEKIYANYTAYNGHTILPKLLSTENFYTFRVMPLHGTGAFNKNLAMFPRKIKGKYAMLARIDGVNNYLMYSDRPTVWNNPVMIQEPRFPWEFVQIGNCGSPLWTEEGWRSAISDLNKLPRDRKSTRLNSSHTVISYAVFCLKKKKKKT